MTQGASEGRCCTCCAALELIMSGENSPAFFFPHRFSPSPLIGTNLTGVNSFLSSLPFRLIAGAASLRAALRDGEDDPAFYPIAPADVAGR